MVPSDSALAVMPWRPTSPDRLRMKPTAAALAVISELEPFDRGRYAGAVGWVGSTGEGEWAIALRCVQIEGQAVTAYAGCGVVANSDAEAELNETTMKFRPVVEALSLVVIDKIPFAPPDDPVLSARIEQMKQQGRNAFMEYQLPRAVINVKQGAGRLIRDETDRGVLMICDPRLLSKPYGRRVWQSLPPMKRTKVLSDVIDFFASR